MIDDDYDDDDDPESGVGFDGLDEPEFGDGDDLPEGFGAETFGEAEEEEAFEADSFTNETKQGRDPSGSMRAEGTAHGAPGGPDDLAWRETYFVLFDQDRRPTVGQVQAALADAGPRITIENLEADDQGLFLSLLVKAPQDNAAIEVSYEAGQAVADQSEELAGQLSDRIDGDQLARLRRANARLDVMHFEQVHAEPRDGAADATDDDLLLEALDPATLITVVEALSELTDGLPIDPAAGEVLS